MRAALISVAVGVALALLVSFFTHDGAAHNFGVRLGLQGRQAQETEIRDTIALFNKHYSLFFSTGGSTEWLNEFPASNLVKRRIFQEIDMLGKDDVVAVYDKDLVAVESVRFFNPSSASVVTTEAWFIGTRKAAGRARLPGFGKRFLRSRYLLIKTDRGWRVADFEVFSTEDEVPQLSGQRG